MSEIEGSQSGLTPQEIERLIGGVKEVNDDKLIKAAIKSGGPAGKSLSRMDHSSRISMLRLLRESYDFSTVEELDSVHERAFALHPEQRAIDEASKKSREMEVCTKPVNVSDLFDDDDEPFDKMAEKKVLDSI